MTTYYLTDPDSLTTTAFEEVDDDMMKLETRYDDREAATAFVSRAEARAAWAAQKVAGRVAAAGWPALLDDPDPAPRCEDPESHDGEPCDCDWKRAQGWTYCNSYTPGGAGWRRFTPES